MSGVRVLAKPANVVYVYDGGFEGFLCCVYESVYSGELPLEIWREDDAPLMLLETRYIDTDTAKAERVRKSIPEKISSRALDLISTVFLSCLERRELLMLIFLLRAYNEGGQLLNSLGDPDVAPLLMAERHLGGEAHLLKGFVRFSDIGGALVATISPKNFILPFLENHFRMRYNKENFMIFDKTHKAALVYQNRRSEIISIDSIEFPEISEREAKYHALWKRFYDTVAIEGRENPRCRMTHMPKRYWENMLEVRDLLQK